MIIRKSEPSDLDAMMAVYASARAYMAEQGNPNQWIQGYPQRSLLEQDIAQGVSYVVMDETGEIVGTFFFRVGEDPTYARIYRGAWLNQKPYGVVHRLASNGKARGVGAHCLTWCEDRCESLRVDTHSDNRIMQELLLKAGFTRCGIIYVANGTERIAFQK